MQLVNTARVGLSWYRRVALAVLALVMAATVALAANGAGDPTAAGDDAAVLAGGSWSGPRLLAEMPDGPGFDSLGASWN